MIPCQRWILKELSQRNPSLEDKASCSALPKTTPFHRNRTHKLVILWGNGSLRFSCTCWTYQHNVQHMQCGRTIPILPCFSNSNVFSCLLPVEIGQSPSARDLQHGCCANLEGRDVACGGWWWNVASSRHYERGSMERARKERAPPAFCSNLKPQLRHWSVSRCFKHSEGFKKVWLRIGVEGVPSPCIVGSNCSEANLFQVEFSVELWQIQHVNPWTFVQRRWKMSQMICLYLFA